jgi:hypothetical protein
VRDGLSLAVGEVGEQGALAEVGVEVALRARLEARDPGRVFHRCLAENAPQQLGAEVQFRVALRGRRFAFRDGREQGSVFGGRLAAIRLGQIPGGLSSKDRLVRPQGRFEKRSADRRSGFRGGVQDRLPGGGVSAAEGERRRGHESVRLAAGRIEEEEHARVSGDLERPQGLEVERQRRAAPGPREDQHDVTIQARGKTAGGGEQVGVRVRSAERGDGAHLFSGGRRVRLGSQRLTEGGQRAAIQAEENDARGRPARVRIGGEQPGTEAIAHAGLAEDLDEQRHRSRRRRSREQLRELVRGD